MREGLRGVAEWEKAAGALTPDELAAGEILLGAHYRIGLSSDEVGDDIMIGVGAGTSFYSGYAVGAPAFRAWLEKRPGKFVGR